MTEDAASTSTVTMTFPKAGSASESLEEQGAALINKCLAFNSGSGLSTILINRTIENQGAIPFATADRMSASLGYTVEPENAVGLVPLLATDCTFEKWDVRDAKKLAGVQISEANESVQVVLTEQLYAAAYGAQSSMGRPFYNATAGTYEIASFRSRGYGLNGAILAATGVSDHAAFCTEVADLLSEAPAGTQGPPPSPIYLGGEARLASPGMGCAHVALAFDTKGVASPMRNILKECLSLAGKEAGVTSFATASGLVGVYAAAASASVGSLEGLLVNTLTANLSSQTIKTAKALAKASAAFNMDCGSKGLAAAMTTSIMETGSFTDVASIIKSYDAISESAVNTAMSAMLKTNPSLAAVGDIGVLPYQGTFASKF